MTLRRDRLAMALIGFVLLALFLLRAMVNPFTHDEHQFVAAGVLLAREGLLPFIDFPHTHLPNLSLLFVPVFALTDMPMLAARITSGLAAWAFGLLGFWMTYRHLAGEHPAARFTGSLAIPLLLITNPIVQFASGRAWNHDLPALMLASAFIAMLKAEGRPRLIALSGVFFGLSVGFRSAYFLAAIPLGLAAAVICSPEGKAGRRGAARFALASALSWVHIALLFALEPIGFLFGNVRYHTLNTAYLKLAQQPNLDWLGKLGYVGTVMMDEPLNWIIPLLFGVMVALVRGQWKGLGRKVRVRVALAISLPLSLLVGSFIPTPAWPQYFHAPMAFGALAIGLLYGVYHTRANPASARIAHHLTLFVIALTSLQVVRQLRSVSYNPNDWVPLEVHRLAETVRARVGRGKVLTLAPMIPLEGDLEVYPELATGPFSWRVSQFLTDSQWQGYAVVSPDTLSDLLEDDPPAGILLGFEARAEGFSAFLPGTLEVPLEDYARAHAYTSERLESALVDSEITLWVP